MAQKLRVQQSLWAMERRLADEPDWPLQTQLAMIRDAGFDGAGVHFIDPAFASEVPYAITGADGRELSDRWQDAIVLKDMIRRLWDRISSEM